MNIETRKLSLIEYLLQVNDEELLNKVELLFRKATSSKDAPMSLDEFYARNSRSQKEIKEGKLISHADIKKRFSARK